MNKVKEIKADVYPLTTSELADLLNYINVTTKSKLKVLNRTEDTFDLCCSNNFLHVINNCGKIQHGINYKLGIIIGDNNMISAINYDMVIQLETVNYWREYPNNIKAVEIDAQVLRLLAAAQYGCDTPEFVINKCIARGDILATDLLLTNNNTSLNDIARVMVSATPFSKEIVFQNLIARFLKDKNFLALRKCNNAHPEFTNMFLKAVENELKSVF